MPLDDVWKTFGRTIGIHWKSTFDDLPSSPGVYAWFYPLRVTSHDLDAFLNEVRQIHLYDARTRGRPGYSGTARVGWSAVNWRLEMDNPDSDIIGTARTVWQMLSSNPIHFDELRRVLLRASLLMPPLYVGKATNIRRRCGQHLAGQTDFSKRFETRAAECGFSARRVSDLVLTVIRTENVASGTNETERLIEEILKLVARPPYGVI
jgi:hypothetical protein